MAAAVAVVSPCLTDAAAAAGRSRRRASGRRMRWGNLPAIVLRVGLLLFLFLQLASRSHATRVAPRSLLSPTEKNNVTARGGPCVTTSYPGWSMVKQPQSNWSKKLEDADLDECFLECGPDEFTGLNYNEKSKTCFFWKGEPGKDWWWRASGDDSSYLLSSNCSSTVRRHENDVLLVSDSRDYGTDESETSDGSSDADDELGESATPIMQTVDQSAGDSSELSETDGEAAAALIAVKMIVSLDDDMVVGDEIGRGRGDLEPLSCTNFAEGDWIYGPSNYGCSDPPIFTIKPGDGVKGFFFKGYGWYSFNGQFSMCRAVAVAAVFGDLDYPSLPPFRYFVTITEEGHCHFQSMVSCGKLRYGAGKLSAVYCGMT